MVEPKPNNLGKQLPLWLLQMANSYKTWLFPSTVSGWYFRPSEKIFSLGMWKEETTLPFILQYPLAIVLFVTIFSQPDFLNGSISPVSFSLPPSFSWTPCLSSHEMTKSFLTKMLETYSNNFLILVSQLDIELAIPILSKTSSFIDPDLTPRLQGQISEEILFLFMRQFSGF